MFPKSAKRFSEKNMRIQKALEPIRTRFVRMGSRRLQSTEPAANRLAFSVIWA
jgi:hypothetical protein